MVILINSPGSRKTYLLSTSGCYAIAMMACVLPVLFAQPAYAQSAETVTSTPETSTPNPPLTAQPTEVVQAEISEDQAPGEIIITGTRIARDGYNAPTPVSVVSLKELDAEAPANISDFVNTLPSVRGSSTAANSSGALSSGNAGINTVNLRALGASRTLVLFDGQRSVASSTNGNVDVNTFPQSLVERVEVVTGGASSAYGSDAVSGVINFILDRDFTGVKGEYQYGVDTYGNGANHKIEATAGMPFADNRGHILVSGEYFTQKSQHTINRDWNNKGFFQIDNPAYSAAACTDSSAATVCVPARYVGSGIGESNSTPGGLILSGPLRGTYFGSINPATGQSGTGQLVFGPSAGQWMIGGDYEYTRTTHIGTQTLTPDEDRLGAFGRVSYEFSPAIEIYGQFSYNKYEGESYYQASQSTPVTIRLDNAFLPDSVRSDMIAANLSTISVGFGNEGIPAQGSANKREVYRYVAGASGEFGVFGKEFNWDAYYQRGEAKTFERLTNTWYSPYLANATDAVFAPAGNALGVAAGTIVCRSSLANPTNGCVPVNRLGTGGWTDEGLNYIFNNGNQPLRKQNLKQEVAAINFSTSNLFENWAGPVAMAAGFETRKESVSGDVDPFFNSGWFYGNYFPTNGSYNVKEGYVEAVVPLFDGAELNGAFRLTDYSTSGSVKTWKIGGTWQLIEDIRLRATVSQDIRAPNLGELFSIVGRTNAVNRPLAGGGVSSDTFVEQTLGNINLSPEKAKTYGIGAVVTPRFLPGFAASIDYYNIDLQDAISNYSAQTTVNLCYEQNNAEACSNIETANGGYGSITPGAPITRLRLLSYNFVGIKTEGIDIEASYRREIGPGDLTLRALATHYIKLYTNNGIDFPTDAAGQNTSSTPDWVYRLSAGYDIDNISFQLIGRGHSNGVYDNSFIECQTDCPVSTPQHRTINDNDIKGAFYVDLNANYSFEVGPTKAQAFFAIRNLFDTDPVAVGNGPTGNNTGAAAQTNRNLYDVLGRVYRLGLRVSY